MLCGLGTEFFHSQKKRWQQFIVSCIRHPWQNPTSSSILGNCSSRHTKNKEIKRELQHCDPLQTHPLTSLWPSSLYRAPCEGDWVLNKVETRIFCLKRGEDSQSWKLCDGEDKRIWESWEQCQKKERDYLDEIRKSKEAGVAVCCAVHSSSARCVCQWKGCWSDRHAIGSDTHDLTLYFPVVTSSCLFSKTYFSTITYTTFQKKFNFICMLMLIMIWPEKTR